MLKIGADMNKHLYHEIRMIKGPFGPHHSKVICIQCGKFVKWATMQEYNIYKEIENGTSNQL